MAEASISVAQDQFSCSVCLDLLKDPVTIPCGHSYCMHCITDSWNQEDQKGVYSCPQCRQTFTPRPVLCKNVVFAEMVEKLNTKLRCYAGPGDGECDICTGTKYKAIKSCLVCLNSYCQKDLEQHEHFFKGKKHNLMDATGKLQKAVSNIGSIRLTPQENEVLFNHLGRKCTSLCSAVVQVYGVDINSSWVKKCSGVACLVKDSPQRSYFIRVFDIKEGKILFDQEFISTFTIDCSKPDYITFAGHALQFGLHFDSEEEAKRFSCAAKDLLVRKGRKSGPSGLSEPTHLMAKVDVKNPEINNKHYHKKKKISRVKIGAPSNFRHIGHVGWDTNTLSDFNNLDPDLKLLFDMCGISEDQLKDKETSKVICDFIEKKGGVEAVKKELRREKRCDPPNEEGASLRQHLEPSNDATSSNVKHHPQEVLEAKCPICTVTFPVSELELHASFCGESPDEVVENLPFSDLDHISCEEDVIRHVAAQINSTNTFEICVSRDNMVERGLKLWKRQKTGSPVNPLKITFLGEPGVDTGALRKEFLSTMVAGIEKRLFEGDAKKGKMPKYSLNDLDNELFKVAGQIFAVSIAQGGPAPQFMQEWCYEYLVTGNIKRDDVHDTEISPLIKMIEDASDLSNYTKEILECGYTGPINIDQKKSILRALALHITTKRIPMLQQLREGLEIYDLIKVMQRKPQECHNLFVMGYNDKVDSHYILSHLAPEMSPTGSIKHMKESKIMEFFQDFLLELEDTQPEDGAAGDTLSEPKIMQWITGQAYRHLLVSEREKFKIVIKFDHCCLQHMPKHTVCYPIVSACTNTITLPVVHMVDYESFKTLLQTAVTSGAGFDRM